MASLLLLVAGCASPHEQRRALLVERYVLPPDAPPRDPVILIPGLLGSRLNTSRGAVVWGTFTGEQANPETPLGARLFAHPMGPGPLRTLDDGVRPAGAVTRVPVRLSVLDSSGALLSRLGVPGSLGPVANLLRLVGLEGYYDHEVSFDNAADLPEELTDCFVFDYDWRRDCVENARRLARFVEEKTEVVAARRSGGPHAGRPFRFNVVAHSMGGLIARYYLRYGDQDLVDEAPPELTWAGAERLGRLVLVAPPNGGSAQAHYETVHGIRFGAVLPYYPGPVLATFPAAYQLLPRARHRTLLDVDGRPIPDLLDPQVWIDNQWGLAAEKPELWEALLPRAKSPAERRRIRLDHLRKCLARARGFHAALDAPAPLPDGVQLFLVGGDATPTRAVLRINADRELETAEERPGDGTVTRLNALLDERQGQPAERAEGAPVSPLDFAGVTFLKTDHLTLTQDGSFAELVLDLLLGEPREPAPDER
jgi:pimeloyl-ACP methyl ester carboxylesterase